MLPQSIMLGTFPVGVLRPCECPQFVAKLTVAVPIVSFCGVAATLHSTEKCLFGTALWRQLAR